MEGKVIKPPLVPNEVFDLIIYYSNDPELALSFRNILSQKTLKQILKNTDYFYFIETGNLSALKLVHNLSIKFDESYFNYACIYPDLKIIKFFTEIKAPHDKVILKFNCIKSGNLEVVKYLKDSNEVSYGYFDLVIACIYNRLKIIRYFYRDLEIPCHNDLMYYACSNQSLEIVQYLHEIVDINIESSHVNCCVSKGSLDLIKYFFEKAKMPFKTVYLENACLYGHTDLVRYFYTTYKFYNEKCIAHACDHRSVIKFFKENSVSHDIIFYLCKIGRLDTLDSLYKESIKNLYSNEILYKLVHVSSYHGQFHIMKYVIKNSNISCDSAVINNVCRHSNFYIFNYLYHEHGVPCDEKTILSAAAGGDINFVNYLIKDIKLPASEKILNIACEHGNIDLIKYSISNLKFVPNKTHIHLANIYKKYRVVDFLLEYQHFSKNTDLLQ